MKSNVVQLVLALMALVLGGAAEELLPKVAGIGFPVLLAAALFFLLQGLAGGALKSAMHGALSNMATGFGLEGEALTRLSDGLTTFIPAFILALGCIIIVMVLYGVFSLKFRPKIKPLILP